jgi:hypothetical protein
LPFFLGDAPVQEGLELVGAPQNVVQLLARYRNEATQAMSVAKAIGADPKTVLLMTLPGEAELGSHLGCKRPSRCTVTIMWNAFVLERREEAADHAVYVL